MSESLAMVFPGQGSQKPGMLAEIGAEEPPVMQTFQEASDAIGLDLWRLSQEGPAETQNLTENTQPLLLTASVALWRVWCDRGGPRPALMAGHSLGEFSALVCAGSLGFADAVSLVKRRGQFMQTAVPVGEGAMAAILGLDDDAIRDICQSLSSDTAVVEAVNFNAPGQVVIAGHCAAVEQAIEACKTAGAKRAMPLPVSAPFHTSLMQPAGERLRQALADVVITSPQVPVIHNVHAAAESDPDRIRELLVQQIYSPVNWTGCVQTMVSAGVDKVIECGPGKVLSGLNRRIHKPLQSFALELSADFTAALS